MIPMKDNPWYNTPQRLGTASRICKPLTCIASFYLLGITYFRGKYMLLTPSYDQEYCHAMGLNSDHGHLIDFIIKLPSWANHVSDKGEVYYFIDYGKIIKELPVIFKSKSKITGLIQAIESMGVIKILKVGRSYYIKTDKTLNKYWKKSKSDLLDNGEINRSENRTFYKWNDTVLKMKRIVLKSEPIRTPAISTPDISTPIERKPKPKKKQNGQPSKSTATFNAYSRAYQNRYGNAPLRGAMINKLLCTFVDRVGAINAPLIAEYYLSLNDQWYQKKSHDVGTMVTNVQAIHTQWCNNTDNTSIDHRNSERKSQMQGVYERVSQKIKDGEI